MAIATVDANFPVGTNIDLFDVGLLASGTVTSQTSTSYTVVIGDESIAFSGVGFTYTSGTPSGGTITGMQDSYFGMPQITLQQLNIPVLSLIHISEPTRLLSISYAVFCLKKKTTNNDH